MKVLLINPPFYRFMGLEQDYVPLSLLAVGSKMIEEGRDVVIKNMEVGPNLHYEGYAGRGENYDSYLQALDDTHPAWTELAQTISDVKPDIVGVNVLNVKYKSALKVLDIARTFGKDLIVGGNHPSMNPGAYPKDIKVYQGEYESEAHTRLNNLDHTPFPYFNMLLDQYSPNGYAHILSSRGCPFNCGFCASKLMWNRKVTYKSIPRLLNEMYHIYHRFAPSYFTFWDEVFTLNKKRLAKFCSRYNLPAQWRCDSRADILTEDMVVMMRDAGCASISIGVESSDNDILKQVRKNETTDDFLRVAKILNKHNIQWKAYMIIGFPQDTEKTIRDSIDFVKKLGPFRITLSFFTPYEGTDLYNQVRALGLIGENYDRAMFSHQSPYNYFCPKIPKSRYRILQKEITKEIDLYNQEALKIWT